MMTRDESLELSTIHYIEMPEDIHGAVRLMKNGRYLIAINNTMNEQEQRLALNHELAHIALSHFDSPKNIYEVEREADELAAIRTA